MSSTHAPRRYAVDGSLHENAAAALL